ncbi:peptidyl-prolyl cis-trans isomerase A [Tupaia chinensis]|uniref:peptidyl-prolyl cis-trans isomerase A n=1 Tax=Tupaia chinensis TaxID=246437 RepID=UPI0007042FF1|nr:peptidyl-prolyl cis-trans isomerase A [Tupaia chinensis]
MWKQQGALGPISFELLANQVLRTAENVHALSTGEKGCARKGSSFHRIIPGFTCQGGDLTRHDGSGSKSIDEEKFDDENVIPKHTVPGSLSTSSAAPNANASVFHLHCQDRVAALSTCSWQGGRGQEFRGSHGYRGPQNGKSSKIAIADCGRL